MSRRVAAAPAAQAPARGFPPQARRLPAPAHDDEPEPDSDAHEPRLRPRPGARLAHVDRTPGKGIDIRADIRDGLPLDDGAVRYTVAMHFLQDLPWGDIVPALREIRRVTAAGGVLRLGLPDLERAIDAWRRGDAGYFFVPDADARAIGAKLVTQIIWYGSVHTPFTHDFAEELLVRAGWSDVRRCAFGRTASAFPDIVSLDNRERESLFVEATA